MKKEKRFHRTLKVLVNAYLKGQFDITECSRCLVGIILADHFGVQPTVENYHEYYYYWTRAIWSQPKSCMYKAGKRDMYKEGMNQIKGCGYTAKELAMIENSGLNKDEGTDFDILMDAYDVIAKIHEVDDAEIKQSFENQLLKS